MAANELHFSAKAINKPQIAYHIIKIVIATINWSLLAPHTLMLPIITPYIARKQPILAQTTLWSGGPIIAHGISMNKGKWLTYGRVANIIQHFSQPVHDYKTIIHGFYGTLWYLYVPPNGYLLHLRGGYGRRGSASGVLTSRIVSTVFFGERIWR